MASEGIFRFITVRPARKQATLAGMPVMVETSELYRRLAEAAAAGADRGRLRETAAGLHPRDETERTAELDVAPLRAWFYANEERSLGEADLDGFVSREYERSLNELVEAPEFAAARAGLSDRLLAAALLGDPAGTAERDLLDAKLLGLAASARAVGHERSLGDVMSRPATLPGFLAHLPGAPAPVPAPPAPAEHAPEGHGPAEQDDEARVWLDDLARAHRELLRLVHDGTHLDFPSVTAAAAPGEAPDVSEAADAEPRLSDAAAAGLSERTRGVLDRLGLPAGDLRPFRAIPVLEAEIQDATARAAADAGPSGTLAFDGGEIDLHRFHRAMGAGTRGVGGGPPPAPQHSAAGLADLLVVRQKIKAYELGEFAHIENVMSGETRDRSTRRLTQVEVTTEDETETETEKERDLQSTERSELQTEAEKHVKSQLDIEAGLQVSGSYGPAASFSSSVKAGSSASTEESQRKASSFSQEVTQRTAEKVRERVRSLVRRRTLEEFEETNRHAFSNSLPKHVRGVYRWLNKVYDAQVFNYGQRFMFDFVVPEPAAYFLYGLVENPPQDSELVKPQAPTTPDGQPLRPSYLTRANYTEYVARYRVANAPAPPPSIRTATFFDKQDGTNTTNFGRAGKIEIPEGYAAKTVTVQATHLFEAAGLHNFHIVIGGQLYVYTDIFGAKSGTASGEKEISISIVVTALAWSVGVDVGCVVTPEAEARWQQSVYDAVIAAYQQQLAEYNERAAQRELQRSTDRQFGRNPLVNRRVERDELKKWVVMMLAKKPDLDLDSFKAPVAGGPSEPVLDLDKANANGRFIRFLENAFEWQNMLYVCYPHLWGRRARWISALNITDPDADFAAFLRAGAARVQVPVRPGFESAVAYFVYTGNIWDGNDVPRIDDDLYVPIIDEITTNLGKLDNGVPYPANSKPWEVIIPTDLVLVQDVTDVPPLRDALKPGTPMTLADGPGSPHSAAHTPTATTPSTTTTSTTTPSTTTPSTTTSSSGTTPASTRSTTTTPTTTTPTTTTPASTRSTTTTPTGTTPTGTTPTGTTPTTTTPTGTTPASTRPTTTPSTTTSSSGSTPTTTPSTTPSTGTSSTGTTSAAGTPGTGRDAASGGR
ncbi:hypothetical protein [Actinomadura sp. WMMA1423]|uniref:hypothetical protein n=1 Tax=Actinomadura sp. WMMA1423 TaxID=2591108 RepID=UPI00197AC629|nr:hypothetical protein [Actinomadura sp. WMMA1423]